MALRLSVHLRGRVGTWVEHHGGPGPGIPTPTNLGSMVMRRDGYRGFHHFIEVAPHYTRADDIAGIVTSFEVG